MNPAVHLPGASAGELSFRPRALPVGVWARVVIWLRAHPELARAAGLYTLLMAGLELVGVLSVQFDHPLQLRGQWIELLLRPGEPNPELVRVWERWDALWYMQIAQHGYSATDGTTAFFPLYPGLMHVAGALLRENYALAGLLLTAAVLIPAMACLEVLERSVVGAEAARRAVLYTAIFPTAFFLFAPYTEGIFLLLVVGAFLAMRSGRWGLTGILGVLLGLTRAQGALLMLPMAWEWLEQRRLGTGRPWPSFLYILGPGLGLLLFTAYIRFVVGQDQAGFATQANWGYHVVLPWQVLGASLARVSLDPVEALNLASLVLFSGLTVAAFRRLPFTYVLYSALNIVLILTRQMDTWPLMSVSRYVLVLFPGFLMLGLLGRHRWVHQTIYTVGLLMGALLFYQYVHFRFVA